MMPWDDNVTWLGLVIYLVAFHAATHTVQDWLHRNDRKDH